MDFEWRCEKVSKGVAAKIIHLGLDRNPTVTIYVRHETDTTNDLPLQALRTRLVSPAGGSQEMPALSETIQDSSLFSGAPMTKRIKQKTNWKVEYQQAIVRLRLSEARADDATRQYNAEHEDAMLLSNELTRTLTLYKKLLKEDGWDELTAELNMEAYESAQLQAKTNHTLLTEA